MKKLLLVVVSALSLNIAQAAVFAESASQSHKDSVYGKLGFSRGGLAIAGEFERNVNRTYSLGAILHIQPKDDTAGAAGLTAIGGYVGMHIFKRSWDFYVKPGFGILMADSGSNKETALGPQFNMGVKFQYSKDIAFGMERSTFHGWLASDFKGMITDVVMATFQYGL
ncbi:MAG: hypothetical protein HOO06_05620 [Bdellovibrionaceae bacterium]|jgi:hypothetical protein|nr:hypothetical protein [Pseudobdellovibrionaceae bacterium]